MAKRIQPKTRGGKYILRRPPKETVAQRRARHQAQYDLRRIRAVQQREHRLEIRREATPTKAVAALHRHLNRQNIHQGDKLPPKWSLQAGRRNVDIPALEAAAREYPDSMLRILHASDEAHKNFRRIGRTAPQFPDDFDPEEPDWEIEYPELYYYH